MSEDFIPPYIPPAPFGVLWHAPGMKTFQIGIDRGMLYTASGDAVPWPGLTSVEESPINTSINPFYVDGIRRRNDHRVGELEVTISAFTAPLEFGNCEGEREIAPGLSIANQRRESFSFSYRALIGSDTHAPGEHYYIHIVYDAMVEPQTKTYESISGTPNPTQMSWNAATLPVDVFGNQPTSRIKVDTRRVIPEKVSEIEYILYGTEFAEPRLPSIVEVMEILNREVIVVQEEIPWEEDEPYEEEDTP